MCSLTKKKKRNEAVPKLWISLVHNKVKLELLYLNCTEWSLEIKKKKKNNQRNKKEPNKKPNKQNNKKQTEKNPKKCNNPPPKKKTTQKSLLIYSNEKHIK